MKFHVAPLPSCSGTRMSESLCRCTFYLRLKLLATKLHHLFQITKSVFGRLRPSLAKEGSTFSPSPSSIVFTTPSVPLLGDRNLRKRGCNRPPVLRTATLYGWRGIKTLAMLCGMEPPCFSLLIGTARIVPHCSIALHLSSLE